MSGKGPFQVKLDLRWIVYDICMIDQGKTAPEGAQAFTALRPTEGGIRTLAAFRVAGRTGSGLTRTETLLPRDGGAYMEVARTTYSGIRRLEKPWARPESFHQTPQIPIFEAPGFSGSKG